MLYIIRRNLYVIQNDINESEIKEFGLNLNFCYLY